MTLSSLTSVYNIRRPGLHSFAIDVPYNNRCSTEDDEPNEMLPLIVKAPGLNYFAVYGGSSVNGVQHQALATLRGDSKL
ncbi:hypothetical protein N7490_005865 [Penicillium lividum]|nr:hypothetical protein N7490_005865 [Penicillium lividum]